MQKVMKGTLILLPTFLSKLAQIWFGKFFYSMLPVQNISPFSSLESSTRGAWHMEVSLILLILKCIDEFCLAKTTVHLDVYIFILFFNVYPFSSLSASNQALSPDFEFWIL